MATYYKPAAGAQIIDRASGALIEYATGNKYYDLSAESGLGGNQYGPQIGDPIDNPNNLTLDQLNAELGTSSAVSNKDVFGNTVGDQAGTVYKAHQAAIQQGAVQTMPQRQNPADPNFVVNSPVPSQQPQPVQNTQVQSQPAQQQQVSQQQSQQTVTPPTVNLQPGSRGDDVKQLQNWLISQGYNIPSGATGFFGDETKAALAAWQQANGVDTAGNPGYFGPRTMAAIGQNTGGNLGSSLDNAKSLAESIKSSLETLSAKGYGDIDISQLPEGVDIRDLPEVQSVTNNLSSVGVQADPNSMLSEAQSNPIKFVSDLYSSVFNSLGLGNIKSQYETYTKRIEDITNEMNDKIADINDDPWLSEGVRLQKIDKIKEKYAGRLDSATNTAKLLQGFYDEGNQTAQFLTGQAMGVFNKQVDFANDVYLKTMDQAAQREELLLKAQIDASKPNYAGIKEVNGGLYDLSSGQWLVQPKVGGTGTGVNNQMTDNERALMTQFKGEPIVKDYNTILAKKLTVDSIIRSGVGGPGDLATVYEFMKGLDPTSVVRETEYASAAKSGNIFLGTLAKFNGYFKENGGFMPPQVQQAFQSILNSKLQVQKQLYDNVASEYTAIAERQGLNPQNVIVNYSGAATGGGSTAPATISKGSLSDTAFVEKALTSQKISYNSVISATPAGQIAVLDNNTGQVGYIPVNEFTNSQYTRL